MKQFPRLFVLFLFLLFTAVANVAAGDEVPAWFLQFRGVQIPNYDKDVKAVVLQKEMVVNVASDGKTVTTTTYVVRILAREGRREAVAVEPYLVSSGKIREIKAWLMRPDGSAKSYGKDQVIDRISDPDDIYNESRVKIINASDEADALTRLLNARRDLLSVPQSISLFEPDNTDRLEMTGISNLFRDVRDATNLFVNTPFDDWAATIPRTADQITTALQGIEVRGFENLSTAITDVITGTSSLKEAFGNLARSIIGDIIQMTVRMLIFRAVSAAFPGSFGNPASIGGGTSSFFNSNPIGGDLFRANGGPVSAGKPYVVGERGPEWFVPRNSGTIIPNQGSGGQTEIVVRIEGSELLDARIVATSQRTVAAAAPRIVAVSTQHTARTLQRRRIS